MSMKNYSIVVLCRDVVVFIEMQEGNLGNFEKIWANLGKCLNFFENNMDEKI